MGIPEYFISCDWGTTNFRLRLITLDSLAVLAEHKSDQGIKVLYEKYLLQNKVGQTDFFICYLKQQIQLLPVEHQRHPVVVSGMASSNIGLQELEYADMPFDGSGSGLIWRNIALEHELDIMLISGVKSKTGMMRGEETQAIGLEQHLGTYRKAILLLPGTHSKHLSYQNGKFTRLKNFMTGELFDVISKKSILATSVTSSAWNNETKEAFIRGLSLGKDGQLTSNLFSIRAKHVISGSPKEDNYYILSGMLISDELSYLAKTRETIFLAAPDPVFSLYRLALESILAPEQLVLVNDDALERALLVGQKKILKLNET